MNIPSPIDASPVEQPWFYCDGQNQAVGPVSLEVLKRLNATGIISPQTLVVEAGGVNWRNFSEVCPRTQDSPPPLPQTQNGFPPLPRNQDIPPLPRSDEGLKAGPVRNINTEAPKQPAPHLTWVAILFFAVTCPPIAAVIALCSTRVGRLSKIVFSTWGGGFLAFILLGVFAARSGYEPPTVQADTVSSSALPRNSSVDSKVPPPVEIKSPTDSHLKTESRKTFDLTPESFRLRLNRRASEADAQNLRIDAITVESGEVTDTFSAKVSDDLFILGAVSKTNNKIESVTVMSATGSMSAGANFIALSFLVVAGVEPMEGEENRRSKTVVDLIGKAIGEKDVPHNVIYGGVKMTSQTVTSFGTIMFVVEPS